MAKISPEEDKGIRSFAKVLTIHGYRNSPIEDIHAGTFPSSKKGDYSDVKVVTPYGEIPWNKLSRISDEEMKHLNKTIYNQIYTLLVLAKKGKIPALFFAWGSDWDEPEFIEWS